MPPAVAEPRGLVGYGRAYAPVPPPSCRNRRRSGSARPDVVCRPRDRQHEQPHHEGPGTAERRGCIVTGTVGVIAGVIAGDARARRALTRGARAVRAVAYSQPLRLKIAYSVALPAAMTPSAMG